MMKQEGVIKFQLDHHQADIGLNINLSQLNAWRTILHRIGLIGQDPGRYQGLGFGNISQKLSKSNQQFLITGTQTGQLATLKRDDYCLILEAEPLNNQIKSRGYRKPSSETLSHAAIYQQSPDIQCIVHAHCPEIWKQTKNLGIAYTASSIAYGTPEMAFAIMRLFATTSFAQQSILSMLGHKDGIFTFGATIQQAAQEMIKYLALALVFDQHR